MAKVSTQRRLWVDIIIWTYPSSYCFWNKKIQQQILFILEVSSVGLSEKSIVLRNWWMIFWRHHDKVRHFELFLFQIITKFCFVNLSECNGRVIFATVMFFYKRNTEHWGSSWQKKSIWRHHFTDLKRAYLE
jgi:hypothetical protein